MPARRARIAMPWSAGALGIIVALAGLSAGAVVNLTSGGPKAPLLIVVVATLSGVVAGLGLEVLVIRPLRVAMRAVERLAGGNLSDRTGATGVGETAGLLSALDDLAGLLESRTLALAMAERRYRRLYERNPAGLFRTRLDGRVVDCNMAAVRMLGYDSILDATTRNAATYYADARERDVVLARLEREGEIRNLRMSFRRKDGEIIPVLLTLARSEERGEIHIDGMLVPAPVDAGAPAPALAGEHL